MVRKQFITLVGSVSFLYAITISLASASTLSLVLFPIARSMFLAVSAITLILVLIRGKIQYTPLISISLLFFIYTYGVIRGHSSIMLADVWTSLIVSFLVVSVGQFFFSLSHNIETQNRIAQSYIIFSTAIFVFLVATSGVIFNPIPIFVYDIYAASGSQVNYSQGMSAFFGFSAIAVTWLSRAEARVVTKVGYAFLIIVFLSLSFLGGARGESVFGFLVVAIMIFRDIRIVALLISLIAIIIFSGALDLSIFYDLTIVSRLNEVLSGESYGMRDVLALQAFSVLADEPRCLFWGCGYFFFQTYFGYSYGLYPHNIILEALISWGLIVFLALFFAASLGALGKMQSSFLGFVGVYSILLGLKSGDIVGSWIALIYIFHLAGCGISNILLGKSRDA